jgi:crossover junction endodeoxyribonuclease RuvC
VIPADPHVIGLDTSLARTGLASSLGWATSFPSKPEENADYSQRADRIAGLLEEVATGLPALHTVDLAVIEGPGYSQGAETGAFDRAGFWWALVLHLQAHGVPYAVVPPDRRACYATGHPRAEKDTVLRMMRAALPGWGIDNHDEADAAVLAAMGRDWLGRPLYKVDRARFAALDGCAWPVEDPEDLFALSSR